MKLSIFYRTATAAMLSAAYPASQAFAESVVCGSAAANVDKQLQDSHGVMIRAQINEQGQEFVDTAEMRVVTNPDQPATTDQAGALWDQSVAIEPCDGNRTQELAAVVDGAATHDRYPGWSRWTGRGWQHGGYFYNHYRPYYRGTYSYRYGPYYGAPRYYWNGYRYYYYPRYRP